MFSERARVSAAALALGVAALSWSFAAPSALAKAKAAPLPLVRLEATKLGEVLADSQGLTLYWFAPDRAGHLACQGKCLKIWPPLLVPAAEKTPVIPKGIAGKFGTVARGKERQLTWDGHPLYTFIRDKAPGQVNGEGVKKLWWAAVVKAAAKAGGKTKSSGSASGGYGY